MLHRLRSFFESLAVETNLKSPRGDDPRVAAAALLFHLMDADGVRDESERQRIRTVLGDSYGLDADELDDLLMAGEEAEGDAVDMHAFTSVLMRHWSETQRAAFVGLLWEVAYADGELHEMEDHTLWRVADLLAVDGRERMLLKQKAAQRRAEVRGGD